MQTQNHYILLGSNDYSANLEPELLLGVTYDILIARRGTEVLEMVKTHEVDLILLDVNIPETGGYSICEQLKTDSQTMNTPVLLVTDPGQPENETVGLNAGAIDYISKPLSSPLARARIHNYLQLKQYQDFLVSCQWLDELTGIPNRIHLDDFLENEWRRTIRNQMPIAVVAMEIDYFNEYNEHYGKLAGDNCLRQVANCLAGDLLRPADLLVRYHGEKFICVLPETNADGALKVANRLYDLVKAMGIPHAASPISPFITISAGVVSLIPGNGLTPDDLLNRTDAMLAEAKKKQRRRIEG